MYLVTDFNVAGKQVSTHGEPNGLMKLEAKINSSATPSGATTLFLQIHDSQGTPAEAAVPIKSWPCVADSDIYKEFKSGELQFTNGCYVCVSTTEATKTLGTGSNVMSMVSAELFQPDESVTVVGDLTSTVASLQVWAEASGPNRLRKLDIITVGGGTKYLMIFAKDSPTNGDTPVEVIGTIVGATTSHFFFGVEGKPIFSQDAGTGRVGCTIALSTTQTTLTAVAASQKIRAEYV